VQYCWQKSSQTLVYILTVISSNTWWTRSENHRGKTIWTINPSLSICWFKSYTDISLQQFPQKLELNQCQNSALVSTCWNELKQKGAVRSWWKTGGRSKSRNRTEQWPGDITSRRAKSKQATKVSGRENGHCWREQKRTGARCARPRTRLDEDKAALPLDRSVRKSENSDASENRSGIECTSRPKTNRPMKNSGTENESN
jgi:hypothetical protein